MINKIGECSECGRTSVITKPSLTLCYMCNNKRLDEIRGKKTRKKTGEYELFIEIWNERPHVSFVSGKSLSSFEKSPLFVNMFAHVLSKGSHPKFRLKKENIVLLTPHEHMLFDTSSERIREDYGVLHDCTWQPLYRLKEDLKEQYNQH